MLWIVARASIQSITIDEADTYLAWVRPPSPMHWTPHANNHVLNSMLMRLVTTIFGASPITLRTPALIGALLYIAAAYCLVRLISPRKLLQWALFVCLVFSPFVMDYLVAARGYSLASAFLFWMLALAAQLQARDAESGKGSPIGTCVMISVAAALCIAANFSFAVAAALTGLSLYLWICREHRRDYLKILAAFTLPGLAVAYFLVGSVVRSWPKGQFTWGAQSMLQTVKSLLAASLFEPSRYLLNPRVHHYFVHFGTLLYPILAALILGRVVMLLLEHEMSDDRETRLPSALAAITGAALLSALIAHEILNLAFGILLPLDRTAMWAMLFFLTMAGALAAVPVPSKIARISGIALTAFLFLIACYNISCLRLTYFNEWQYDADMKNVYTVLAHYNRTHGLSRVSTNWRYVGAINCYRALSGGDTIDEIPSAPSVVNQYPAAYQAYVVFYPSDADFCQRESLQLIYHDDFTGVAIAVRPEVLATP